MSNTIRIRTTPNGDDKYLKVKLEQDFDFIEILSLKISQEDAYRKFCSDYGVIVGRVVVNTGFGVPNAKVSVFIPIDEVDNADTNIKNLYPYEVVTDKNIDGIRYNLLPKESENNNTCYTPVGTFPTKRQILDNETISYIYCKYYKFTTTTNYAGDFMIFGAPVGTHIVHVDVDISDIGVLSQRPYNLISQGTPKKLFDSSTKFSKNLNLDKLPQVKTFNIGVNVQPFWGDLENCEVGITRVDIDLNYNLIPSAIFMGSIFGDQDKESVSKRCNPREELGELCQQITNEGTVEILRKNEDGENELFLVEGGNVIDENGAWAFEVPMNLDYVVTDEEGNIIPSNDRNTGIPTRTNIRFRIGMYDTGELGRVRTRAKYLVPNNPQTQSDIEYTFDETTQKDASFRNLYWNKIYSVSNFIPRYQKDKINIPNALSSAVESTVNVGGLATEAISKTATRNFTGIKNVDACAGDKTPFPYNRLKTKTNPLFLIICVVIKIISFLVSFLNAFVIPLINIIIGVINNVVGAIVSAIEGILNALNFLGINISPPDFNPIDYIPCVVIECGDGNKFAPGCSPNNAIDNGDAYDSAVAQQGGPNFFFCQSNVCLGDTAGLDDCMAFQMATTLNLFQFDFYNDWINGSLYSYLVKYKYKRKGRERFCEYDCADFGGGVDGNEDGNSDNNCYNQILLDTMYPSTVNNENTNQNNFEQTGIIREGLIKKKDENLYYASTLHNVSQKLFATDIICLGSVFECDWQGFPKLNQYLIPTSYKLPPAISELGDEGVNDVIETGMLELTSYGNTIEDGLFFSINCLGIRVNARQALNMRHICEMFVDTDQAIENDLGIVTSEADGIIGKNDIDDDIGKEFRDIFLNLNIGEQTPSVFLNTPVDSNFNVSNAAVYDFTSPVSTVNGPDYIAFRGYPTYNTNSYTQPKNSYFMYFGLVPGKTAVDLMNQNYFQPCPIQKKSAFILQVESTSDINNDSSGSITFNIIGGVGPSYEYTVTGPNGFTITSTISVTPPIVEITNLSEGNYTITVTDSTGNVITQTVVISGPTPLYASVSVSQNDTSLDLQNGQITIFDVGGGVGPYTFVVTDGLGNQVGSPNNGEITNLPLIISGLGENTTEGYTVTITDSNGNTFVIDNLIMTGIEALVVTADVTPTTCYDGTNGIIDLNITGGIPPYIVSTTGPNNFSTITPYIDAIGIGTYVTNVIDSEGNNTSITNFITSLNPQITIISATNVELAKQCDPLNHHVRFKITAGVTPDSTAYISYQLDNQPFINTTLPYVDQNTMLELIIPKNSVSSFIKVKVSNSPSYECYSNQLTFTKASVQAPLNALLVNVANNIDGQIDQITISGGFQPYSLIVVDINNNAVYIPITIFNNSNSSVYTYTSLPLPAQLDITVTDNVGCQYIL
jgi:hypothetical protein